MNAWLSSAQSTAKKQQLVPRAEKQRHDVEQLLGVVLSMKSVVSDNTLPLLSYATKAEMLEQLWMQYSTGTGQPRYADGAQFVDDGSFDEDTAIDFSLSKKEAQKQLTSSQFKLWKKFHKKKNSEKQQRDEFDDD